MCIISHISLRSFFRGAARRLGTLDRSDRNRRVAFHPSHSSRLFCWVRRATSSCDRPLLSRFLSFSRLSLSLLPFPHSLFYAPPVGHTDDMAFLYISCLADGLEPDPTNPNSLNPPNPPNLGESEPDPDPKCSAPFPFPSSIPFSLLLNLSSLLFSSLPLFFFTSFLSFFNPISPVPHRVSRTRTLALLAFVIF